MHRVMHDTAHGASCMVSFVPESFWHNSQYIWGEYTAASSLSFLSFIALLFPTSPLPCPSHSLLCSLSLSLPCGWTQSSLSSAWRMKSASRPSTTTTAGWPTSGAPVTSHWSWWAPRVSQVLQTPGSSVLMGLGNTILL